jgi:Dockerin type I domain
LSSSGTSGVFRLFCDGTGDGRVDVADLGLFAGTYLKTSADPGYLAFFDVNADGRVDVADLGQFAARYLTTLP